MKNTPLRTPIKPMQIEGWSKIKCPHCMTEQDDSEEWGTGGDDYELEGECNECGMLFIWSRQISITYSTRAKGGQP